MAKSLQEILEKTLARVSKITENIERIKTGKPRIKTLVNSARSAERSLEKSRRDFLASTAEKRTQFLSSETDLKRIEDKFHVTKRGLEQGREILKSGHIKRTLLALDLLVEDIKRRICEEDVVSLAGAIIAKESFDDAYNKYAINKIATNAELEAADTKSIWNDNVTKNDVAILTRGMTVYDSIDYHANNAKAMIKDSVNDQDAMIAMKGFVFNINELFERFNLTTRIDISEIP